MALVTKDRVKETTTTTGTGTYTLAGAVTGFQAFSVIGNANTCGYAITDGTDWEVGVGTYTLSGTTLARTSVLASSNAGAAVNWGAGTKTIWCDFPADAPTMRQILGLIIGTDVQAFDSDLSTIAGLTATTDNFMQSKSNAWASRTPTQAFADLIAVGAAAQSDQETGTSTVLAVTPGRQQFHPSAAKAWGYANGAGTSLLASYNVGSITDNGTGDIAFNFTTNFSSTSYASVIGLGSSAARFSSVNGKTAAAIQCLSFSSAAAAQDPGSYNFAGFGDL
jgi:hypothetical protein